MLRRGDVFAGYVIDRELGRGGMGSVYAARHPRLPKLTALKLLHREMFGDTETRLRFAREADLVARLDHPNIVTVYDRGVEDDQLWICMQYVDGVDTDSVPAREMTPARAVGITVQIAGALDYAHRAGVLHRDVKPANILLSRTADAVAGFEERALLTDFGIAKPLDDSGGLTRTGTLTATLAYASPEQLSTSALDHRSDQYSLACTLFRLLTGAAPYPSPHVGAVVFGHLQSPPPSIRLTRSALPVELDEVITKGMAKDPADRFPTCADFAAAANRALRTHATVIAAPRPAAAQSGTHRAAGSAGPDVPGGDAGRQRAESGGEHAPERPVRSGRPERTPGPHERSADGRPPAEARAVSADTLDARRIAATVERRTGPEAVPGDEAAREVGSSGRQFDSSATRSGTTPEPRRATARQERNRPSRESIVRGCLVGGAVGDALGAPVENMLLRNIRQRYGMLGVTGAEEAFDGRVSDETQLTLFTAEALIKGSVRARSRGIGGATLGIMQQGFLVWLRGQGFAIPEQPVALHSSLAGYPELMSYRGTTQAAITALQKAAARCRPGHPLGTRATPINDSKGSAAVARAAPCGFGYAADRAGKATEHIFELGCDAAALTHGNPGGWLPAGTMAAIVYGLCRGADLAGAVAAARVELVRHDGHEETEEALEEAVRLAAETGSTLPEPEQVERLGRGWLGSEALAIGIYCASAAAAAGGAPEEIVRNGILLSVNHSGDSDATGTICGSLLGAMYGHGAIPAHWRSGLDADAAIQRIAADYCVEFGPAPPRDEHGEPPAHWRQRYAG